MADCSHPWNLDNFSDFAFDIFKEILGMIFMFTSVRVGRHIVIPSAPVSASYLVNACQGLKMCMKFGCNPQIIICHFICSLNLVIFWLNRIWTIGIL